MAPLTWRNVDAPNFSNVGDSLRTASALLTNGTSSLSDALASFSKQAQAGDSSAALAAALGYTDDASLGSALRNGTALGGINPRNISPDILKAIGDRQNALIRNEGARLNNTGQGIQNNTAQFNLDEGRAAAARGQGYRDNQPAANEILTRARALYDSGNAAQIAEGRRLITDNSRLFTSAGLNASDILNTMVANTAAAGEGIRMGQAIAADEDFYTERFRKQGQKGVLNSIVSDPTVTDAASAVQKLQGIQGIDAQTKANLVKDLQDNAGAYFPAPSVLDTLPVRGASPTSILQQAGNQSAPVAVGGTVGKILNVESGGNGNAKNPNSSATGAGQFTDGTWLSMIRKYRPDIQGSNADILALRRNNALSAEMTERYAQENNAIFGNAGIPQTETNTYLGHFLGPGGAVSLLKASNDTPVSQVLGADQINANKSILQGKTVGEVKAWAERKMGGSGAAVDLGRDSTIAAGGIPTGATGILSSFTGPTNDTATQVTPTTVPAPADITSNVSSNQPGNAPAPASVEQTPAERNAALLSNLQRVGDSYRDSNGNLFREDGNGSFSQVDSSGIPIGGGPYQPQALAAAQRAAAPAAQVAPALSPTQLIQNAQTVANTGVIDNLSNDQATLENLLSSRPDRGKTVSEIAKGVSEKTGVPSTAATQAIREIMQRNNVDADVAGYLAQQSPEARDLSFSPLANALGFGIPNALLAGDRFGRATEGRTAPRIDTERATDLLRNFRTQNSNEAGANAPGVNRLNTAQNQQVAAAQVQLLQVQAQTLQSRVLALTAALQRNPGNAQVQQALLNAQAQLEQVNASLNQVNRGGQIAPYIRSAVSQ
jgi:hypothetical protein